MKTILIYLCVFSLVTSCNKNNDSNNGTPVQPLLENYPQRWVLTVDESNDKYTYLQTNLDNMFRSQIPKSYSLLQLAIDKNCEFHVAQSRSSAGKICYTMQLKKKKDRWVHAGPSTNLQEVHLGMSHGRSETDPPGEDAFKFNIHRFPDVDGVKTVALESVLKPGWYISVSGPGFNYSPSQAVLTKEIEPKNATRWQCR